MTTTEAPSPLARRISIAIVAVVCVAVVGVAYVAWGLVGVHKAKLEPSYRAAQAVGGSTHIGVTYLPFVTLLQQLQTELSMAGEKRPTSAERAVLTHWATATGIYADSLVLWKLNIKSGQYLDDLGEADSLKVKYNLPVAYTGAIDSEAGIQMIWAKAADEVQQGNALFNR